MTDDTETPENEIQVEDNLTDDTLDADLETDEAEEEEVEGSMAGQKMSLQTLKDKSSTDLLTFAESLGVENASNMRKQDMLFAVLKALAEEGVEITGSGVMEVLQDGFGFLRSPEANYLPGPDDIYVSPQQIRRHGLRTGDTVEGPIRSPREGERYFALLKIQTINFEDPENIRHKVHFDNLTPLYPDQRLWMEIEDPTLKDRSGRIIDIVAPLKRDLDEKTLVMVGRVAAVVAVIIAVIVAKPLVGSFDQAFQYIQDFTGFFTPGIVVIFALGMFWKRCSTAGAFAAVAGGFLMSCFFYVASYLHTHPDFLGFSNSFMATTVPVMPFMNRVGWVFWIALGLCVAVSLVVPNKKEVSTLTLEGVSFKTTPVVNALAIGVIVILVGLYWYFW